MHGAHTGRTPTHVHSSSTISRKISVVASHRPPRWRYQPSYWKRESSGQIPALYPCAIPRLFVGVVIDEQATIYINVAVCALNRTSHRQRRLGNGEGIICPGTGRMEKRVTAMGHSIAYPPRVPQEGSGMKTKHPRPIAPLTTRIELHTCDTKTAPRHYR